MALRPLPNRGKCAACGAGVLGGQDAPRSPAQGPDTMSDGTTAPLRNSAEKRSDYRQFRTHRYALNLETERLDTPGGGVDSRRQAVCQTTRPRVPTCSRVTGSPAQSDLDVCVCANLEADLVVRRTSRAWRSSIECQVPSQGTALLLCPPKQKDVDVDRSLRHWLTLSTTLRRRRGLHIAPSTQLNLPRAHAKRYG